MTAWLKQSTSVSVVIGPIWATADGALKADLAYNASGINCDVYKNGTKADVTLANSAGDGYFRAASGEALYLLTLSTGHTDTLGMFTISLSATGYYMKPQHYMVVPANVWDSMFGADKLQVDAVQIEGGDATDALSAATPVVTLADDAITAAKFDESTAFPLKSADTGATAVARTGADSDTLETLSDEIAGVTAPSAAAVADAVWDEAIADHAGVGSTGAALAAAGGSGDPWATALPGAYGAGTAGYVLGTQGATGSGLSAVPWNAAWDAEVQSECTDALNAYDPPTKAELDAADDATLAAIAALSIPTATENADALLNRDMSAVSDTTARSPLNALRQLRNRVAIADGTMTVYEEDDTTEAWTGAVTTSASVEPITEIDPA